MTVKVFLIPMCVAFFALSGCGSNDQPAPSRTKNDEARTSTHAAPEKTTLVAEDKIQLLGSDVLAAAQPTGATCSLDSVDGNYFNKQMKLTSEKPHVFRGWLLNDPKHSASNFSLVLKGARDYAIPAITGVVRGDVGDYFKDPTLSGAGFDFSTTLSSVPAGEYHVVFVVQRDQKDYFCDSGKTFTVE